MPSSAAGCFAWGGISLVPRWRAANEQYERFYLGSVGRNLTYLQTLNDRTRAKRLVDRFLNEELDPLPQSEASRSGFMLAAQ